MSERHMSDRELAAMILFGVGLVGGAAAAMWLVLFAVGVFR
jgi:hypothetical protein